MVKNESSSASSDEDSCLFNNNTLKSKLNVETPLFKQPKKKTSTEETFEMPIRN